MDISWQCPKTLQEKKVFETIFFKFQNPEFYAVNINIIHIRHKYIFGVILCTHNINTVTIYLEWGWKYREKILVLKIKESKKQEKNIYYHYKYYESYIH